MSHEIDHARYQRIQLLPPRKRACQGREGVQFWASFCTASGGNQQVRNRRELSSFLDKPSVFVATATEETSEQFAVTKEALRQTGTPLPMNDVWIAAHCLQLGATMVTLDGHFSSVPGLRVWPPAA